MKYISYFLLGAAVGAIIALLFTPQTGEELRANLRNTAESDLTKLQAEANKIQARLEELQSIMQEADAESEPGATA